ncbi:hypothetical protein [Bradyrhizobium archetypum]|uniref:hypothetical protein n=1 Tax=Bradyrhizobium archetypum TaxID=2721160 RepID=UPI001F38A7A7|nr:hypothetical protein [Bradyrhizobium archetypum]
MSRTAGSPDPGRSAVTQRVMTIMRSDEYWVPAVPSKKRPRSRAGVTNFIAGQSGAGKSTLMQTCSR